jgi:alpha-mannosidase
VLVDQPRVVRVAVTEEGLLRGRLVIERTYAWPRGVTEDLGTRTASVVETAVVTTVELRADEPFVRLRVDFDNASRDHRVRFHVPLPGRTDRSYAEGQFAIVARGLEMEGGHGEHPLPTFPAHGLAAADGAVALLVHLTEFELVDGRELALTIRRSTGLISRDMHPWRAEPAGPVIEAPTGQGIGPRSVSFAVLPHRGAPGAAALRALERYRCPFGIERGTGPADARPARGRGLAIEGDGIVMTALRRVAGVLELRIVNETPEERQAVVRGGFAKAWSAGLAGGRGAERACEGGTLTLDLGPWEIATLHLAPS